MSYYRRSINIKKKQQQLHHISIYNFIGRIIDGIRMFLNLVQQTSECVIYNIRSDGSNVVNVIDVKLQFSCVQYMYVML